jgi:hypothetical protein
MDMKKEKEKKDRWWIADILIETSGILVEIFLLVPRVILRIVKDIN